jgi:hypothetical protein
VGENKYFTSINHLKKWKERSTVQDRVNVVIEDGDDIEDYQWTNDDNEICFGEESKKEQKETIRNLLLRYKSVLRQTSGRTSRISHHIRTSEDSMVRLKPYRVPQAYQEKVNEELKEMERTGIIEQSTSEWASPLVIVKKKDGGIRLCVDYRQLNQITKFDAYPMPRVEDMLDKIGNCEFITTLDLAKGYWQVPMEPKDGEKTAFTSPRGLYQFTTMPFGLSGAPATFQCLMDNVLRGTEVYTGAYQDDIVIPSSNWEDHLKHLEEVLNRLQEAGLTIKLKKCTFADTECIYLGYRIGRGGVRPENSKVESIVNMSRPQTKKDVRTFLGMTGYYRRFV